MENTSRTGDRKNPSSPTNSPNSNGTSSNGAQAQIQTTSRPSNRSETTNPYPTTFVQADTSNFKQVVQMLTGSSSDSPKQTLINSKPSCPDPHNSNSKGYMIPPIRAAQSNKKQGFKKLYERRKSLKNGLMITPSLISSAFPFQNNSPRKTPEILSPSMLDFPNLALSPVTPLTTTSTTEDPIFSRSSSSSPEEAKAIAEKGFYLHPSPMMTTSMTQRDSPEPPQLLPLFPVTSPRVSGSSSS